MSEPKNRIRTEPAADLERMPLVGPSSAMQEIRRALGCLVQTDLAVMIIGESGTGKEFIARLLHDYGKQKNGPFVTINMAAVPCDVIEGFEEAKGGTLFLDEIGDMPTEAQPRLLHVLRQAKYTSVGGRSPIKPNIRVITATNKDVCGLIRQGLVREDLFYRLNVVPLRLPPLRERLEDIAGLAQHFFSLAAAEGLPLKRIAADAVERLKQHRWPGNIRELQNLTSRLAALYPEETVTSRLVELELGAETSGILPGYSAAINSQDMRTAEAGRSQTLASAMECYLSALFHDHDGSLPAPGLYYRTLREIEYPLISAALAATRGNQLKAAELLGLNRNTLCKKVRKLDIKWMRSPR
jgi:two-component system, NtrC family, nitrogen regulation response regulator GlnG